MTHTEQLFLKRCQNNLFRVFSHIMMHKICALSFFLLELTGFLTCLQLFQLFISFLPVHSQKDYCFSITFHDTLQFRDFPGLENEITIKIP